MSIYFFAFVSSTNIATCAFHRKKMHLKKSKRSRLPYIIQEQENKPAPEH